MSTEQLKVWSS